VPGIGRFPYVRLRGDVAIIGLSSAVPRLPIVASGEIGAPQRMALHALLAHDEVTRRYPVILQHHPWHPLPTLKQRLMQGLIDAEAELEALRDVKHGLLLHGHLHRRVHRTLETPRGTIHAVGATSASLLHDDVDRMSGFNVYDIDDGEVTVSAHRLDPATEQFIPADVPRS
jgi:hypothetical protein